MSGAGWSSLQSARPARALAGFALLAALAACTTTTTTTSGGEVISSTTERPGGKATDAEIRNRASARNNLAAGYFRNGQLPVALDEARKATAIDPTYADAYGLQGLIYMGLGDQVQAEQNFLRSLKLDPTSPDLNNNYGWFLCQAGRESESFSYFQRALSDPLYGTPARANQNAGICYAQVKDYANAERFLRRALELDAGNNATKYQLARVYLALGQADRAAFYYGLLSNSVESSAATIWLGLRVARAEGNLRNETQLARELRQRFPASAEAAQLARGAFDD